MDDATARRQRGVVVPASPDGRRGAQLRPATTAPHRRDGGQRQRGQWTRANNNQPLRIEGGQAAACGKSSGRRIGEIRCQRGGQAKRRRINYHNNEEEDCARSGSSGGSTA